MTAPLAIRRVLLAAVVGAAASAAAAATGIPAAHGETDCAAPAADASRIAVAGGSITEILYALGEAHRLVAVDTTSTFPADAARLPSVGYVRNLSAEGLLSMSPTLVLGEHDMGPDVVLEQIAGTGVEVVRIPETFSAAGILDKVLCVGRVLGVMPVARRYAESELRPALDQLDALASAAPPRRVAVLLAVREGAPTAAGLDTSGDGLLGMIGAENVFTSFSGWKPVSLEHMTVAAPDVIVVPRRGVEAAGGLETLLTDPAIRMTPAARNRQVLVLDGMAMLGFGPRTLDSALELAGQLR